MNSNTSKRKYSSLSRNLILWFLLLSTLPLMIVSYLSYYQTNLTLKENISKNLTQSSILSVSSIKSWFKYRFMDVNIQAESNENVKLLSTLIEGFSKSNKPLNEYVKSYDWSLRTDGLQDNLIKLSRGYDYIYDLFLLDIKGNLLFTVAHESDLGTNMLTGIYAKTLFSKSIKRTIDTGKVYFSDIEHYAPSNNIIAGFITAPLLDEFGNKLGVFAVQLRIDKVLSSIRKTSNKESSLTHYLIGEDGKLRSSIKPANEKDILRKVINTEQFLLWKKEYSNRQIYEHSHDLIGISEDKTTFDYMGPDGKWWLDNTKDFNY